MKQIGIYQIFIGEHFYFGQSKNLRRRKCDHLSYLKRNAHRNARMQAAYNKYKTFEFIIVVECDINSLTAYEQDFIDAHYGLPKCMNICSKAEDVNSGGPRPKRPPMSQSQKDKIAATLKGKQRPSDVKEKLRQASLKDWATRTDEKKEASLKHLTPGCSKEKRRI